MEPVSLPDIQKAAERLGGVAHTTPVLTSRQLDEASCVSAPSSFAGPTMPS